MNKQSFESNGPDVHDMGSGYIDFGGIFGDRAQVCDYTPSQDEISKFIPTVAGLIGREITKEELDLCARMLRKEYLSHGPFRVNRDLDDHVYNTPFEMSDGTPICVRIVLRRLGSIRVENADKKMCSFVVCNSLGQKIGTLRSLPWAIVNIREIAFAIRHVFQGYFPHDLLGSRLVAGWLSAGGSDDLPTTIFLAELQDGTELSVRFTEVQGNGEQPRMAKASILVDQIEMPIRELQPLMLRKICAESIGESSMDAFYDMKGAVCSESYRDWLFVRIQRYDYLSTFQSGCHGECGILPATLMDGEAVEVFHTGDFSIDGKAIYGVCRDWRDGCWNSLLWVYAEHLLGVGVNRLPPEPNWSLEWRLFDSNTDITSLSRHVLHNAHRWADPASLTGRKDELGHDIFLNEVVREDMYEKACQELEWSMRFAKEHPDRVSYGYYHPSVDRFRGNVSPIAIYLPGFFSKKSKEAGVEDVAFAVRTVKDSCGVHYEVPTILPIAYIKRTERVLGTYCDSCSTEAGETIAA